VDDLIADGIFHPHMRRRIPEDISHVYGHQEEAISTIHAGRTTLVSTGTGSGKTKCLGTLNYNFQAYRSHLLVF
jgi:Lhr-like helicase